METSGNLEIILPFYWWMCTCKCGHTLLVAACSLCRFLPSWCSSVLPLCKTKNYGTYPNQPYYFLICLCCIIIRPRHPQDSSPDNPLLSSKRMWTKKSTKPKKKKRNLNQCKLERKDVPENVKALEVSLAWLFYTFSAFYFKFLRGALQLHIRILWKSLNPKVPSPTPTNEMINQFHACRRNSRGAESGWLWLCWNLYADPGSTYEFCNSGRPSGPWCCMCLRASSQDYVHLCFPIWASAMVPWYPWWFSNVSI